jgi:hypothetical protein
MPQINITPGTNVSVSFNKGPLNGGTVGGESGQLQYNKNGVFGGVTYATFDGSNIAIADISNLKINGGVAGQTIVTDGAGNLVFATAASGNGTPSGPDFSVQIANAGNFYGESYFKYTPASKTLEVPSIVASSVESNLVIANSLTVDDNVTLPQLPKIFIGGGVNGQVITTDGNGNLSWTTVPTGGATPPAGSNTQIQFNDGNVFGADVEFTYNKSSNTLSAININATNFYGNGQNLTDINGANVFGVVPLANISYWSGNATSANHATEANYANFAGDVVNPYQANIVQVGTLEQLTVEGIINLNDLSNIHITGGNLGDVITSDGSGNLLWTSRSGNGQFFSQPALEFTAPISSHNQVFSSPYIASFASGEFASIYVNGVLQDTGDYSITGGNLTIKRWIGTGDSVTVGATGTGSGSTPNSYPTLNGNDDTYLNGIGQWQSITAIDKEIELEFDHTMSGSVLIGEVPSGAIITDVTVIILNSFGALAEISVGDAGNSNSLMATSDNLPSMIGSYSTEPAIRYSGVTPLSIRVTPNGSSVGNGLVTISYS